MSLNLCLHVGGQQTTIDEVRAVPTPDRTKTWVPIPHHKFIDQVVETVEGSGLRVIDTAHGLHKDGQRYFGLLHVANGHSADDYGLVIGLRNSHDQSFPVGLALGAQVFVCDNLSFSGEVKLARKHTSRLMEALPGLVHRGVARLVDHRVKQDARIEAYKAHELEDRDASHLIVRAMEAGVCGTIALPHVLHEWRQPKHEAFQARTVWSLFNAFTEVAKGNAQLALGRTQKLHGLCDAHCGLAV